MRYDWSIVTAAALACTAAACAQPTPEQTAWLRANGVAFKTVEASNGFADLQPLRAMIGDARVVGLGEGTHGTREHFQLKHRLIEFLVEEMGFSIFSIEANMPESYRINPYVLGEAEGDVDELIRGMYFWTWKTEEVRDLVEWMRRYNTAQREKGSARRVQFTGFDMQTGAVALGIARDFIEKHDKALADREREDLDLLAAYNPFESVQATYGCATGKFPVELVRGKKIRFTGWARTEKLVDGWAALWWRVDGPSSRFDNMAGRALEGTTDWTEMSIEMEVPADAHEVYFGVVMPGRGRAWFDGLRVEIDGVDWRDAAFDLSFEGDTLRGIVGADPSGGPAPAGYTFALDREVKQHGAQSARLASDASPDSPSHQAHAKRMTDAATRVLEAMTRSRDAFAAAAGASAADWAIQNMRVVSQWTGLAVEPGAGSAHRDTCMADNAKWILDQHPGAKMVVWAHNWHVRDESPWMGSHLRRMLGRDYVNVAFSASRGMYRAFGSDRAMGSFALQEPPASSFEAVMDSTGEAVLLVDLRKGVANDPGSGWLTEHRPFGGIIGAMAMPEHYHPATLRGGFDLLVHVRDTSPARALPVRQQ